MKTPRASQKNSASTLLVTIVVFAVLIIMLGLAFELTSSVGRDVQRMNTRQQVMAVGESTLEILFAQYKDQMNHYSSALGDLSPKRNDFITYLAFKTATSKVPTGAAFPELAAYFPGVSNFSALHLDNSALNVVTAYNIEPLDASGRIAATGTGSYVTALTPKGLIEGKAYRYLATVDVQLPTRGGQMMKAHLSRVLELELKSFLNYAIFSNMDLEIHPGAAMSITGPVHTNETMYVGDGGGTLNFTDTVSAAKKVINGCIPNEPSHKNNTPTKPTGSGWDNRIENAAPVTPLDVSKSSFDGDPVNNKNNDSYHEIVETPVFPLTTGTDPLSPNDRRLSSTTAFDSETLQTMRFSNVADYVITIDNATHDPKKAADSITVAVVSGNNIVMLDVNDAAYKDFTQKVIKVDSTPIQDQREAVNSGTGTLVNLTNVDIAALKLSMKNNNIKAAAGNDTGLGIYIEDKRVDSANLTYPKVVNPKYTSGTAFPQVAYNGTALSGTYVLSGTYGKTIPAIRLKNGATLPTGGLSIVTPNPVYVQGDYNTGQGYDAAGVLTGTTPACIKYNQSWPQNAWADKTSHDPTTVVQSFASDTTQPGVAFTDPNNNQSKAYYWQPAAIIGDAITVLSNNWSDATSTLPYTSRTAKSTIVNSAFFAGNVATTATAYSGGIENFPRFLENWSGSSLYYVGSMVLLYNSIQATGVWKTTGNYYDPPARRWAYDKFFLTYGVPLLSAGGSGQGGAAGGGSRKSVATGGAKIFERKQWISRTVQ